MALLYSRQSKYGNHFVDNFFQFCSKPHFCFFVVVNTKAISIKSQINFFLLQELHEKVDKIAQLEKEKASLIRELFEARAKGKGYDDTTFM